MRSFADIQQQEPGLARFLSSPAGTLYVISAGGWPETMVRHFDGEIAPTQIGAYTDLIAACANWIYDRPELAELVDIEQPSEIGQDFVARRYFIYEVSTRSYDTIPPPPELATMRERLTAAGRAAGDDVVWNVLSRSLLEPSGRVFFDEPREQFILVEPKIERADLA